MEWKEIEAVFEAALDVPTAERRAWLAARCGHDAELRREVESLLAAESSSEAFLQRPAFVKAVGSLLGAEDETGRVGERIGLYKILREIGRGGMGVVYLAARDDKQFRQRVAIKILKRGMDTEDILRRFRNERQILAALHHPHIATVFDGGTTADGLPFFVMEYVEGLQFLQYCDEHSLSMNERLRLFRHVCAAVQHAHQNLVIHRDLKPSNILVTHEGEVKLLDFGVAKLLNPELTDGGKTETQAARIMTPEYASPEQVRGQHVTTATDIYSLGVILFELLTGARPYQLKDTSPEEWSRVICDTEPSKPSDAIADSKGGSSRAQSAIHKPQALRGDLDNIILKALRKEPERRYKSVEQFSDDIERHLKGLPVMARKDTLAYRASKFIGRNRVGVAAAAIVALSLIAGIIATLWQARVARAERDHAQAAQVKAEKISVFLATALSYSDPSMAQPGNKNRRDATINQMLDDVAPRIETELASQPEVKIALQRIVGMAYLSQFRIAEAERYSSAALETQLKLYGEDHLETARIRSVLGNVQVGKGDYAGAEPVLRQAVTIFRKQHQQGQRDMPFFVATLVNLGDVLWSRGDYKSAEPIYEEALALSAELQEQGREAVVFAKTGLGFLRYAQGRLDEAASLLRQAVNEYRSFPHLRAGLSDALNRLGQVLTWQNKLDEALSTLRESESISTELFGRDNMSTARSLYLITYALLAKGDYEAATKALDETEAIYQRIMPGNKIIQANNYDERGLLLTRTGRASKGESFGRKAVELYEQTSERGAASITLARLHLAESLTAQKKYEEAERVLQTAYKDASEVQGAEHWRTKETAKQLAALYEIWKKPEPAKN